MTESSMYSGVSFDIPDFELIDDEDEDECVSTFRNSTLISNITDQEKPKVTDF